MLKQLKNILKAFYKKFIPLIISLLGIIPCLAQDAEAEKTSTPDTILIRWEQKKIKNIL